MPVHNTLDAVVPLRQHLQGNVVQIMIPLRFLRLGARKLQLVCPCEYYLSTPSQFQ